MRLIISAAMLLASAAAVPAFAQDNPPPPPHHDDGGHHDGDRHDGGGPRGNGGAQPQARPAPQPGNPAGPGGARPAFPTGPGQPHGGQGGYRGPLPNGGPNGGVVNGGRPGDQGGYRGQRPGGGDDHGYRGGPDGRGGPGRYAGGPGAYRGGPGGGDWNRGWRQDQRYDWQGWRNSHRDFYHVDRYRAPYGYGGGYRRFGIGFQLDAGFFAQQYWIGNPGYYRLPPAYGPYRWVRYYNDALLVNIYNGYIVDEIPDFFY